MRHLLWLVGFVAWLGSSGVVLAQDEPEEEPAAEAAAEPAAGADDVAEPVAIPEDKAEPAAASGGPPKWFVGAYIEGVLVPSFLLNLFLAESPTVFNPSFGATITHRDEEGFSWAISIGYASYSFAGPFRADGDPELDTEYLDSSLGLLHARGVLTWSVPFASQFAFEYGVGIEFGAVLGEMTRTEAYKGADGEYHPCSGPGDPNGITMGGTYCEPTQSGLPTDPYDAEGAHYGVVEKRVPPVAATLLLPQLALRYAPIPKLAIKLEASYGIMQFTFGLSAAYAIDG